MRLRVRSRGGATAPTDVAIETLGDESFAVGGRGKTDDVVGVYVVDVVGSKQRVQWRVDRWDRAARAELAVVVEGDEGVFVAAVQEQSRDRDYPIEREDRQS